MESNIVETLKFLMRDIRKLADVVQELKKASHELNADIVDISERLEILEEGRLVAANSAASATGADPAHENSEADRILDLPLKRVLDLYDEFPQVIEPVCRRAALVERDGIQVVERNGQGNYWVLQLRDQGHFLLPRPGAFVRTTALQSLADLFEMSGERRHDGSDEFKLEQPANLILLRRHQRWQLEKRGHLRFGIAPLECRWQRQLRQIELDHQQIKTALAMGSQASLTAEVSVLAYQQKLLKRYGEPQRVLLNTCVPMAYALYLDPENGETQLVPCSVQLGSQPRVLPAWDAGVPWKASLLGQAHSNGKISILRSSAKDPRLPSQTFLADETAHTWAIASGYSEATTLAAKLAGNWGPISN